MKLFLFIAILSFLVAGCQSSSSGGRSSSKGISIGDHIKMEGFISTSATTTKTKRK